MSKSLSKKYLATLGKAETTLRSSLDAVRKMRRLAHGGSAPPITPPKSRALAAATPSKKVKIYQQLLGLFASDHKPVAEVRPETPLGQYPLGYNSQGLEDFYRYKVNAWFEVNLSTADVGTDGTVWDLVVAIDDAGGNPR